MSRKTSLPPSTFPPLAEPSIPSESVLIEVRLLSSARGRTHFEWDFIGPVPESLTFLLVEAQKNEEVTAFTYTRTRADTKRFSLKGDQRGAKLGFALVVADPERLHTYVAHPPPEPVLSPFRLTRLMVRGCIRVRTVSVNMR